VWFSMLNCALEKSRKTCFSFHSRDTGAQFEFPGLIIACVFRSNTCSHLQQMQPGTHISKNKTCFLDLLTVFFEIKCIPPQDSIIFPSSNSRIFIWIAVTTMTKTLLD